MGWASQNGLARPCITTVDIDGNLLDGIGDDDVGFTLFNARIEKEGAMAIYRAEAILRGSTVLEGGIGGRAEVEDRRGILRLCFHPLMSSPC